MLIRENATQKRNSATAQRLLGNCIVSYIFPFVFVFVFHSFYISHTYSTYNINQNLITHQYIYTHIILTHPKKLLLKFWKKLECPFFKLKFEKKLKLKNIYVFPKLAIFSYNIFFSYQIFYFFICLK
jgi:hypothetical protein